MIKFHNFSNYRYHFGPLPLSLITKIIIKYQKYQNYEPLYIYSVVPVILGARFFPFCSQHGEDIFVFISIQNKYEIRKNIDHMKSGQLRGRKKRIKTELIMISIQNTTLK